MSTTGTRQKIRYRKRIRVSLKPEQPAWYKLIRRLQRLWKRYRLLWIGLLGGIILISTLLLLFLLMEHETLSSFTQKYDF
jgi:hypothetical protein